MPFSSTKYLFVRDGIANADDKPGVYALYNQRGDCIYIGQSEVSVRSRLLRHVDGYEGACTQRAYSYSYALCANPTQREATAIFSYRIKTGRLPPCNTVQPMG